MPGIGGSAPVQVVITGVDDTGAAFASAAAKTQAFERNVTGAGTALNYSMREARGGVMLLGEEIGVKLNRHVAGFIANIAPIGGLMSQAFAPLAIITLTGVLVDYIAKLRETKDETDKVGKATKSMSERLADAQMKAGAATKQAGIAESLSGLTGSAKTRQELANLGGEFAKLNEERRKYADQAYALEQGFVGVTGKATDFRKNIEMLDAAETALKGKQRELQAQLKTELSKEFEEAGKKAEALANKMAAVFAKVREQASKVSPVRSDLPNFLEGDFRMGLPMRSMSQFGLGGGDENVKASSKIFEETRTNAERYAQALTNLNALHDAGAISTDTFNRGLQQAQLKFDDATMAAHKFGQEVFAALNQGILMGRDWSDVLKTLLLDTMKLIFQMTIMKNLAATSKGGGAAGFFGALLGGLFGFAEGGAVSANMPVIVGEKGPEIFMPSSSGSIIPNSGLGGVTNIYQIDARGADAGVEQRVRRAIQESENRAVYRSVSTVEQKSLRKLR